MSRQQRRLPAATNPGAGGGREGGRPPGPFDYYGHGGGGRGEFDADGYGYGYGPGSTGAGYRGVWGRRRSDLLRLGVRPYEDPHRSDDPVELLIDHKHPAEGSNSSPIVKAPRRTRTDSPATFAAAASSSRAGWDDTSRTTVSMSTSTGEFEDEDDDDEEEAQGRSSSFGSTATATASPDAEAFERVVPDTTPPELLLREDRPPGPLAPPPTPATARETSSAAAATTYTARLVRGLSDEFQRVGLGSRFEEEEEEEEEEEDDDEGRKKHPFGSDDGGGRETARGAAACSATVVTASTQGSSTTAPSAPMSLSWAFGPPASGSGATAGLSMPPTPAPKVAAGSAAGGAVGASGGTSASASASSDTPKTALHRMYGKPPRRKVLSASDYYTWHDNGPTHALKWTSAFLCPLTGEVFPSGRHGDESSYVVRRNPAHDGGGGAGAGIFDDPGDDVPPSSADQEAVVWYGKKTLAEHGAAARALDCQMARDDDTRDSIVLRDGPGLRYGRDPPYREPRGGIPAFVPAHVRVQMEQRQAQIRHNGYPAG